MVLQHRRVSGSTPGPRERQGRQGPGPGLPRKDSDGESRRERQGRRATSERKYERNNEVVEAREQLFFGYKTSCTSNNFM